MGVKNKSMIRGGWKIKDTSQMGHPAWNKCKKAY